MREFFENHKYLKTFLEGFSAIFIIGLSNYFLFLCMIYGYGR